MKKLKMGLLSLALVLGVSGAFVTKAATARKLVDPTYDWSQSASAPDHAGLNLPDATISEATSYYECNGGGGNCARGEKVSGDGDDIVQLKFTN